MDDLGALAASLVIAAEGLRLRVYDDATGRPIGPDATLRGHPTIGYGRALDRQGITVAEARTLLDNDLAMLTRQVPSIVGAEAWPELGAARQAALVDMAYQVGPEGLARFAEMLAALRASDWTAAHAAALKSAWARQAPARARRNALILMTGALPPDLRKPD
ncbi:MAG TPA: glycoside hydrolase family protein [Stellaceae bacterium]|nr:glycoside hydrolase family protein [Stellaceae bacterium]